MVNQKHIITKPIQIICSLALVITFFVVPAGAMNSLVSADDIKKMKEARISDKVIKILVAEQTCSVTPAFLVELKKAGADNKMLEEIVLGDRYKNPIKTGLSTEEVEMLKKAGCSEEMVLRLLDIKPVERIVDEQGNESIVYRTDLPSTRKSDISDKSTDTVNINIEKVEGN
ncbi:MAG: hypothetical protein BBJ60_09890 [Desulfobacterales bacterium S7086C20]|nr:hypothetical protein [Deltaproteobacteria bacterium]OEU46832.1 MAG: hypothetical protein BBJ60_09890 [Desulfobacterales bacterium S7086C20]